MRMKRGLPFLYLLIAAVLLELTLFQFSFWKIFGNDGSRQQEYLVDHDGGSSERLEIFYGSVHMENMHQVSADEIQGEGYTDEAGFTHVSSGEMLIRLTDIGSTVEQIGLQLSLPEGAQVKANVYMRDEGNAYTYQLGNERTVWEWVPKSKVFLVYPYGEVKDIFITLSAQAAGQELVCKLEGVEVNGQMPFSFSMPRMLIAYMILLLCFVFSKKSGLEAILFWPEGMDGKQKKHRLIAAAGCVLLLMALSVFAVLANPACRQNLGLHHAQYQELAVALSEGKVAVGIADERLLEVKNPYDTIYLQANQIPYLADYAYKDGSFYVYFGIVPELLCYLPFYLLTGRALPNYLAILLFCAGFVVSCGGLVLEVMRSRFGRVPFYLYPVCVFMLVFGYPLFYMQIRPDLYHVPIAASCMFTAASLWLVTAGCRLEKWRPILWGAGALCMALNAGCRPQFLLFSVLLIPMCAPYLLGIFSGKRGIAAERKKEQGELECHGDGDEAHAVRSRLCTLTAMGLPYIAIAAGIMYYNAIRFGSPFDFGATYSMTSNDMTHRGFNLSRILYSAWYYLFEPPQLEGVFPYIRSAVIEADYMGRLVSESCFGGIFACSMLYWPVFTVWRGKKRLQQKKVMWIAGLSILISLVICAADATGAGVLQRYMADQMFGFALAAMLMFLVIAEWAAEKGVYRHFTGWLRVALLLHIAFLVLILINTDSSVSISRGNPELYAAIWSMLLF